MRNLVAFFLTSVVGLATALAEEGAVAQSVGHGKIDWANKTITATGSGAPSLKAANVAVARLGAERAAKLDALRNILEAVKGVKVSGGESAGARMEAVPEVRSKIEGVVQKFKVLDTKYYSDGGVDVIVQVPLDGVLTETLLPDAGSKAAPGATAGGATGVIINAKGLGATPALAPRLVDDKGKELFSAAYVGKEAVKTQGVCGYANNLDHATKDGRVADKPLVIRAQKLGPAGSDLVISGDDAQKLTPLAGVLAEGKVIIVVD